MSKRRREEDMEFSVFSIFANRLVKASCNSEREMILVDMFRFATPVLPHVIHLILGMWGDPWRNMMFTISKPRLLAIIYEATGVYPNPNKPLREAAYDIWKSQLKTAPAIRLSVMDVMDQFMRCIEDKSQSLLPLFVQAHGEEISVLVDVATGAIHHNIGLPSVFRALGITYNTDIVDITLAYSRCASIGNLCAALRTEGTRNLEKLCPLQLGIPFLPMMAIAPSAECPLKELMETHEMEGILMPSCIQQKYDGYRAQVHFVNFSISIFNRRLRNVTSDFDGLVKVLLKGKIPGVFDAIFDGEIVPVDADTNEILPFNALQRHKEDPKVRVGFVVFDCLMKRGISLMNQTFMKRNRAIRETMRAVDGEVFIPILELAHNHESAEICLAEAIENNWEGIVIKAAHGDSSCYVPGQRPTNWIKYKAPRAGKTVSTIDVLVMGAVSTSGRGVYTSFVVGCFDAESGMYTPVARVVSGLTDEMRIALSNDDILHAFEMPSCYRDDKRQHVEWFHPRIVWEIKYDNYTEDSLCNPVFFAEREDKMINEVDSFPKNKKNNFY